MRPNLRAYWRYRPRILTLTVFAATSALLVLANLSEDVHRRGGDASMVFSEDAPVAIARMRFDPRESAGDGQLFGFWNMSYGWPLEWRQYILVFTPGPSGVICWRYSASRLAGDIAIWLVILGTSAVACEWLLRRFWPRFRWSLRTMLVAVGLVAALCGWFSVARERAMVQDPLFARHGRIFVERWGPKWLDLVGADRYFRRIVGADLVANAPDARHDADVQEFLKRLKRLPKLRYLFVGVERLTPFTAAALGDALGDARQLRVLGIELSNSVWHTDEERMTQKCLASIGQLTQLEHLRLERTPLANDSLAGLAGLISLKTLSLERVSPYGDRRAVESHLLQGMPALPQLEALNLQESEVSDHDLRHLAVLPRLKSLNLNDTNVTSSGLAQLAHLESLEELTIDGDMASAAGLESLRALKRLKKLHIYQAYRPRGQVSLALDNGDGVLVQEDERDRFLRTFRAMRRSKPGIVVDGARHALVWSAQEMVPSKYQTLYDLQRPWAHRFLRDWKEGKGEIQSFKTASRGRAAAP